MRSLTVSLLLALVVASAGFAREPQVIVATTEAPAIGSPAPDYELPAADGTRVVSLSKLWVERPLVLVFGSYT